MRKFISFMASVFLFGLLFTGVGVNAESTNFFEAVESLSKLDSYKVNQSIYGDFKVDSYGEKILGEYRLNFISSVNNTDEWEANENSKVNLYLELTTEDFDEEYKPFDKFVVEARGEITALFADSVYLKLDHINMYGEGIDDYAKSEIDLMLKEVKNYTGTWYRIDVSDITEMNYGMTYDLGSEYSDQEEVANKLKELGYKGFLQEIVNEILDSLNESGELTDKEQGQISSAVEELLDTNFFSTRYLDKGYSEGFTSFRLDRSSILDLVLNLAEQFDEELSAYEKNALRMALNKISISGMYRLDESYGIYDNFLVKIALRNIEELKNLKINYRYKVTGINSAPEVKAPTLYTDLADTDLPFPYGGGYYYDNYDYDDYEWEEDWEY